MVIKSTAYTPYGNTGPYEIKSAKISVEMLLPYRTSKTKLATASNNAKRILIDNTGILHTFYRSGEYIFYNYETLKRGSRGIEEGSGEDRIFAKGRYPAVLYDDDQSMLHAIWISGSIYLPHKLWYRKGIAEDWGEPLVIWQKPGTSNSQILPPSFTANDDTGYVVFEDEKTIGSTLYWKLYFLKFPLANPQNVTEIIIDSAVISAPPQPPPEEEMTSPSIVLDDSNNPHVVWSDKYGHIQYTYWEGEGFVPKEDLTPAVGTINAKRPCIEKYKNRLNVVFELFNDIYFTYKTLMHTDTNDALTLCHRGRGKYGVEQELFGWSELKNLSHSPDSSIAPIILCGSQVFYSEKIGGNWEIFWTHFDGFEWSEPENLSQSPGGSYYVQATTQIPNTKYQMPNKFQNPNIKRPNPSPSAAGGEGILTDEIASPTARNHDPRRSTKLLHSGNEYERRRTNTKELQVPIYLCWTEGQGDAYHLEQRQITGVVPNWQSGWITENTVWQGNVFVTGDVTVKEHVKLTILPGTHVYFQYPDDRMGGNAIDWTELIVKGNLEAIGAEQDSIRFIVYPGDSFWYGLGFVESGTGDIGYSRVKNSFSGVYFYNASGAVHNSMIDSNSIGLYLYKSKVSIKKNVIEHNQGNGIYCEWSDVIIDSNLIYHNSLEMDTLVRISRNQGIRESGYQDEEILFRSPAPG